MLLYYKLEGGLFNIHLAFLTISFIFANVTSPDLSNLQNRISRGYLISFLLLPNVCTDVNNFVVKNVEHVFVHLKSLTPFGNDSLPPPFFWGGGSPTNSLREKYILPYGNLTFPCTVNETKKKTVQLPRIVKG